MKYLKLIRFQNLLLLAFMQLIFRYGFLKLQNVETALAHWQYALLVLSTVLIAAGGYIINDIFDQDTDEENKPEKVIVGKSVSETTAYYIYAGVTLVGVSIGFYLSNLIMRPGFASIFIMISALLYFYATNLKQMLLIGNLAVAFLLSFSVLIVGVFDIFPATADDNRQTMTLMFSILKDYAIFAFVINFIREIVKDMQDIQGDTTQGMSTLPITIGVKWTTKIVAVLLVISTVVLLIYVNEHLMVNELYYATIYALVLVVAPLLLCLVKVWNATSKADFSQLSKILKWIIFFGILSVLVITLNINHNA